MTQLSPGRGPKRVGQAGREGGAVGVWAKGRELTRGLGWPLAVLTIMAALIRGWYLGQPMRYDESYTFLNYAAHPWYLVVSRYLDPNNHIFHNLLVHGVTRVFGEAPWSIRLPSYVAGVVTVPAVMVLARALSRSHDRRLRWFVAGHVVRPHRVLDERARLHARGPLGRRVLAAGRLSGSPP